MSGVRIESAYYGDERSSVNITNSLTKKVSGGVLDVTADASLRPTFEAAPETTLNDGDIKKIEEQTVQACGGTADQACIERTRLTLRQQRLREKENEVASANVIKGERLTLNVVDATGKRRTLVTPGGQNLRVENVLGDVKSGTSLPTLSKVQELALTAAGGVVGAFIWAFSILSVWMIFMNLYTVTGRAIFKLQAYIFTAIATFIPGSGLFIIIINWAFPAFFKEFLTK